MKHRLLSLCLASVTLSGCASNLTTVKPEVPQNGADTVVELKSATGTAKRLTAADPVEPSPTDLSRTTLIAPANVDSEPHPVFEKRQSVTRRDEILSDNLPHDITVLFSDEVKFRVKPAQGTIRGSQNGKGLVAVDGHTPQLAVAEAVLSKFKHRAISDAFEAAKKSEQELSARHAQDSSRFPGFPNDGSWAVFTLDDYSPEQARALVDSLYRLPFVRDVEVIGSSKAPAVTYETPPTDWCFPQSGDVSGKTWQDLDIANVRLATDASDCRTWWWNRHSVGDAWNYTKGEKSAGVPAKVCDIDTAFSSTTDQINVDTTNQRNYYVDSFGTVQHNSLVGPVSGQSQPEHGTEVIHALAAKDNNNSTAPSTKNSCGIAPGVKVLPVKVDYGNIDKTVSAAVDYATATVPQDVILVEVGGIGNSSTVEDYPLVYAALNRAWAANITCVIPAGNRDTAHYNDPGTPWVSTTYTGAICVGAVDAYNHTAGYSNFGNRVDITAAGEYTGGSIDTSTFAYIPAKSSFGTSLAAPLVAGAAALVRKYNSNVSQVRNILIYTSDWANAGSSHMCNANWPMTSGFNGGDTTYKNRVLNAYSACRIAYNMTTSSNPYLIYRPASTEYTQAKNVSATWLSNNWFPYNVALGPVPADSYVTWDYIQPTTSRVWAGSFTAFKNGLVYMYYCDGTPLLQGANGAVVTESANTDSNANTKGWVNGLSFTLP